MNKDIPVPNFVVSLCTYTTQEDMEYPGVMIDARLARDVSNGFIFIDEPHHLFLLRDAVDEAIAKMKLTRPEGLVPADITINVNEDDDEDETEEE